MIRKGYIETSFGLIHYRSAGNSENPHVLLLHQTASSSAMYEAIMNLLADKFYLFAPDTLGFGASDFSKEPATMQIYADSLREATDKFGLENPFVFGHHTGASIAVQMEFDKPFARKIFHFRSALSDSRAKRAIQKRCSADCDRKRRFTSC
ncbi:MAG: alpha/beta fold hydrolase [Blastocatellia bacterium]|nr:alpha/beta fold hydrolase [Blastocatellia bacterium]